MYYTIAMDILPIKLHIGEVLNFIAKPLLWLAILIVCCLLYFSPITQLENFKSEHSSIIIFLALISQVILIFHSLIWVKIKYHTYQEQRQSIRELRTLSSYEKEILKKAINENTTTIFTSLNKPGIIPLRDKNIIQFSDQFNPLQQTYIIPNHIWIHLKKNKKILSGQTGT